METVPYEVIINEIIPYTYKYQDSSLMEDILSFVKTKQKLISMYNQSENISCVLLDDLSFYMSLLFYEKEHYIYGRNFKLLSTPPCLLKYFIEEMSKFYSMDKEINTRLGSMLPYERDIIVNIFEELFIGH